MERHLAELEEMEPGERQTRRHAHFRNIGVFLEGEE
jgi:hypothetical protein